MPPPDFDHKDTPCYRFPRQYPGLSRDLEPDSPPLERALGIVAVTIVLLGIGFAAGWYFCKIGGG
jgi:hypothetical protein